MPYQEVKISQDFLNSPDPRNIEYPQIEFSDQVHGYITAYQQISRVGNQVVNVFGKLVFVPAADLPTVEIHSPILPDCYIAYTNFTIYPGYEDKPSVAHLDFIGTQENYRGQGYATSMVQAFIEIMKNSQMDYLTTSARTVYSQKTFEKYGFQMLGDLKLPFYHDDTNYYLKLEH